MASLIQMLESANVPTSHTERLYFNKYAYRIGIDLSQAGVNRAIKKNPDITFNRDIAQNIRQVETETIKGDFATRSSYHGVRRYYIRDEADAIRWFKKLKPLVCEANCPLTEDQKNLLLSDEKTVIRKHLFWGRYRWRMTFEYIPVQMRADIQNWFEETFKISINTMGDRALLTHYPTRIHVENEKDAFLVKCRYSQNIQKIEKIMLTEKGK